MNLHSQQQKTWAEWTMTPEQPLIIAGPCSAESEDQVMAIAIDLCKSGHASIYRAGVWKPRTRPGGFDGMGKIALEWLVNMREATGMPFMIEVASKEHVEAAINAGVDAIWIGARTTVNPFYVQDIAQAIQGHDIPVMVKNPIHADVGLWLGAIERLEKVGCTQIAAVHRGFFDSHSAPYRNDPKWEISFELRRLAPDLPIVCDPSHIAGKRSLVSQVAQTAMDVGMDGLMVEVHSDPDHALSDAAQQLTHSTFHHMIQSITDERHRIQRDVEPMIGDQRKALDKVDEAMVKLMRERMAIVDELSQIKAEHGAGIFQMDRWFDILAKRGDQAVQLGLDKAYIKALFQTVHKYSVEHQTKVYQSKRKG